jgi:riboflavin kinase/FMN adenylyltransferase
MTVLYSLEELEAPLKNPVLTIGNFDGVHKGHLVLFDLVKERAGSIGGQSVVMTFEPHPTKVTNPHNTPPLITPIQQKLELLAKAGMDMIFCFPFTEQFAAISAEDFVRDILVEGISVKEIVVGYDYTFGRGREGNTSFLKEMGNRFGFRVHVVDPVHLGSTLVSSTSIRNLVQEGRLREARGLLGRDYQICGTVVRGQNRGGRLLGYPTANLRPIDELTPKTGVYIVEVLVGDRSFKGLTNIGYNPTFGKNPFSVETHILDFSEDLVGKTIRVNFIERLRDEKTFETINQLAEQIGRDVLRAREFFQKTPPRPV